MAYTAPTHLAQTATVLALNSGSSSLKFGLYQLEHSHTTCLLDGAVQTTGPAAGTLQASDAHSQPLPCPAEPNDGSQTSPHDLVRRISALLSALPLPAVQAIGHRVVHGGPNLRQHVRITPAVLQQLAAATPFAPLHMPATLALMRAALQHDPALPQVACLDTCFHAGLPDVARVLALPRVLRAQGLQRYGFHGLSCASIVQQLGPTLPRRLLIAHLGNGASVTAVLAGQSVDTSMGLTPTGGLVMGSRSGDLDPGVLAYLVRSLALNADALQDLVNQQSGLLGISGLSSDMRTLHAAAAGQPANRDAALAVALFCYSAAKTLAAQCVALGGVDLIVFTGGIGEHDALVRATIGAHLAWLGVAIDPARNASHGQGQGGLVSSDGSRCQLQVLPSKEDAQIARQTWVLCGTPTSPTPPPQQSQQPP